MRKTLLLALILGVCLAANGCSDSEPAPRNRPPPPRPSASSRPPPGRGGPPPSRVTRGEGGAALFRLPRVDGQPVDVRTPAALFFFTTWCGYCKQAMPEINRLADRARSQGWSVYGINVREGPGLVNGFIQQYQPNFPVLMDQEGLVAKQYGIRGYPTFIVIDQNANIVYNGHEVPRNF